MTLSDSMIRELFEIRRHAEQIVAHREDPCEYWTGHGCEASMVHDAEDIMRIVDRLIPPEPLIEAPDEVRGSGEGLDAPCSGSWSRER